MDQVKISTARFRPLSEEEILTVSGGSGIVVTGTVPPSIISFVSSITPDQLAVLGIFNFGGGGNEILVTYDAPPPDEGSGSWVPEITVEDIQKLVAGLVNIFANLFGKEAIIAAQESRLHQQFNTLPLADSGTTDAGRWWTTTDGTLWVDRDGNGKVDARFRVTEFGPQADNGDGDGWRFLPL